MRSSDTSALRSQSETNGCRRGHDGSRKVAHDQAARLHVRFNRARNSTLVNDMVSQPDAICDGMTGESAREDRASIQKTLALWCVPGCVYELRALGRGKSSGYFRADPTGLEQLCDNAVMLSRNITPA